MVGRFGTSSVGLQNLKRMEFTVEDKKHVLRGYNNCEVQQVNDKQMQTLLHKQAQGGIAQLCSLEGKEGKPRGKS